MLDDLQQSQDNCRTILVLFGLSMALDTIDPNIFLDHHVGSQEVVLQGLSSLVVTSNRCVRGVEEVIKLETLELG